MLATDNPIQTHHLVMTLAAIRIAVTETTIETQEITMIETPQLLRVNYKTIVIVIVIAAVTEMV